MFDQSFSIQSGGEGKQFLLHFRVKQDRLVALHGTDSTGNRYLLSIKLVPETVSVASQHSVAATSDNRAIGSVTNVSAAGNDLSVCCCFDAGSGQIICKEVNGACPDCI